MYVEELAPFDESHFFVSRKAVKKASLFQQVKRGTHAKEAAIAMEMRKESKEVFHGVVLMW